MSFDLRDNGRIFASQLDGILGNKEAGQDELRQALESFLKPFVLANKDKFQDIIEEPEPGEVTSNENRDDASWWQADCYRPGEERRQTRPDAGFRVKMEGGDRESISRSQSPDRQFRTVVGNCTKCGKGRHSTEQCWKGKYCTFCKREGHPTEICKFKSGEWPY